MTQLLQTIYAITPFLFIIILAGATFFGVWLLSQLKKTTEDQEFTVGNNILIKRNATRIRKMEFH